MILDEMEKASRTTSGQNVRGDSTGSDGIEGLIGWMEVILAYRSCGQNFCISIMRILVLISNGEIEVLNWFVGADAWISFTRQILHNAHVDIDAVMSEGFKGRPSWLEQDLRLVVGVGTDVCILFCGQFEIDTSTTNFGEWWHNGTA